MLQNNVMPPRYPWTSPKSLKTLIFTTMPGDSTYIINQMGDTIYVDSAGLIPLDQLLPRAETQVDSWSVTFPFVLIIAVLAIGLTAKWLRWRLLKRKARREFSDKQVVYDSILRQYSPYYRNLPQGLQQKFLKRTLTFMAAKRFRFVEMEREEHMPLLISAAAVQLTFGLDNYLLDHFHTIYVVKSDYNYGLYNVPFQGHVSHDGIYLSWSNFINAFANYTDGDNVGLHEMAHALSYVNFIANDGSDNGFKQRFREFSKTGRAVFKEIQESGSSFLGNYAATNYEEFWAVCVENFFERPLPFKLQMPELYDAMCKLLNQDMLSPGLFVQPLETA